MLLGQTPVVGSHFTDSQEKSTVCSKVAKVWADKCMSFDEAREQLAMDQQVISDIHAPLADWEAVVNSDCAFALKYKPEGMEYVPTDHCLTLMAQTHNMSDWALWAMRNPVEAAIPSKKTGKKKVKWTRDFRDAEAMVHYVNIHMFQPDRSKLAKNRLWRTWSDGTLRAYLSEEYAIVNNGWYLSILEKLIPGGLVSHWRGDADEIFANILIPDTIRAESDSDYGGMLSVGNSEIGTRRIVSMPSVFRAICMNGCIWDQESGVKIDKVHRGKIDFMKLEAQIKENLEAQIPLLPRGIEKVLGTRAFGCGDTPMLNVFAQVAREYHLPKRHVADIITAWTDEVKIVKDVARSAFGIQGAITRFGQTLSNADWVKYDSIAGDIVNMDENRWKVVLTRAKTLSEKEIEALVTAV